MKKKSLHYCYPSSPMAYELKRKEGCWYVQIGGPESIVFASSDKWEALRVFESLDYPVDALMSFTRESSPFVEEIKPGQCYLVPNFDSGEKPVWVDRVNEDGTIEGSYSDGCTYTFDAEELKKRIS